MLMWNGRLVASDLLARGIDLPSASHIVNYDPPPTAQSYIHRAGRTARAGAGGDAVTLLAEHEARWFWRNVASGVDRGAGKRVEKVAVEVEEVGVGWRGVYQGVLFGKAGEE